MKWFRTIWLILIIACEEVVVIELPDEQNLLVLEGWVTDVHHRQYVRLTQSNNFSGDVNPGIADAAVTVQQRSGSTYSYSHVEEGRYLSDSPFSGTPNEEYRVVATLSNGDVLRSDWNLMLPKTDIVLLSVDSFEENDPDNPGQTVTIFFPRITARDSADYTNYYRWILFKNNERVREPESIVLQNDRFFDGNFIPNLFDQFEYRAGDEIKVELHSITKETYDFLNLLRSQITTLGAAASTTPAVVNGNVVNLSSPDEIVLGYFGTTTISADSTLAE